MAGVVPGKSDTEFVPSYRVGTAHGLKNVVATNGYTLPHEHIVVDIRVWWTGEGDWDVLDPKGVDLSTALDEIVRAPEEVARENMVMCDWYVGAKELRLAVESGCQLLVDLTTDGLERRSELAMRAADLAGIDMVLGVGRYLAASLDEVNLRMSVPELADRWLLQCEDGIDGNRPGIIGEIGTGQTIADAEVTSCR